MKKPSLFRLSTATLALSAALASTAAHAQFSQMVVFGDSLSDTGRLKGMVNDISTDLGAHLQPSFSTNPDPVWAQILANSYKLSANPNTTTDLTGTNYAVGGARSGSEVDWNGFITVPSTKTQITTHLAQNGGQINPNALYAIWIGSNDLIAAAQTSDLNAAQQSISGAVARTVADIETLNQLGASTILVPNVPDLSLTPRAIYGERLQPGVAAQARLASGLYNNALFTALNQSTANVIPANTFALLQEAVADKESFGFKNTTGVACQMPARTSGADDVASTSLACTPANLVETDANETYAFADDIHPSGRTHRILAQYYRSLIDSPTQMASVTHALAQSGIASKQNLYRRLMTNDSSSHSLWLDGAISNASTHGGKLDKPNITLGFDAANVISQDSRTGAYLSRQKQNHDLSHTITADSQHTGVGLYHQQDFGRIRVHADIGVDKIWLDTHREVSWEGAPRIHDGKANGRRHHAGLQLSYHAPLGKATVRPHIGMHLQTVQVKPFAEDNANLSTALQYTLPTQKSRQGSIGVDVTYPVSTKLDVQAGLGHWHEFNDEALNVDAKLTSISEYHRSYTLPVARTDANSTYAHFGAKANFGHTDASAGLMATHANGDTELGGYVGLQMKF